MRAIQDLPVPPGPTARPHGTDAPHRRNSAYSSSNEADSSGTEYNVRMVLRQDYILRMIRRLSQALEKLEKMIGNVSEESFSEALDGELEDLTGLPLTMLRSIPSEHILGSMRMGEESDAPRILAAAEILALDAARRELAGREESAAALRLKALGLYLPALSHLGDVLPEGCEDRLEDLLHKLMEWNFPLDIGLQAVEYLKFRGRYSRAEDLLYSMAENSCGKELFKAGCNFYQYLDTLEDKVLEKGRLPRNEVAEGYRSWLSLKPETPGWKELSLP